MKMINNVYEGRKVKIVWMDLKSRWATSLVYLRVRAHHGSKYHDISMDKPWQTKP